MEFNELEGLQRTIRTLKESHVSSLAHYHIKDRFGFKHIYQPPITGNLSKASTATCVLSLTSAGYWTKNESSWYNQTHDLINELLNQKWESADLEENNPF